MKLWFSTIFFVGLLLLRVSAVDDESEHDFEDPIQDEEETYSEPPTDDVPLTKEEEVKVKPLEYDPPEAPEAFFDEAFPERGAIGKTWILSEAKKDGVDENIAKYNGEWEIEPPETVLLENDYGLVMKSKARHHAISSKFRKAFRWTEAFDNGKTFVMQYDIKFQSGQECGGAYVKLLANDIKFDLKQFTDKTPYSIMFGPDKCGLTSKIHFILNFKNPKTGEINEHHAKGTDKNVEDYITDKRTHLYRLEIYPDGKYVILVDRKKFADGKLTDLEPALVPEKEIDDPNDVKPEDWDDREKIPDPDAVKPDDWDEEAPEMIDDESAVKPDDWLEDEEEYVNDDQAEKPEDWDNEMDGEWEPAKVKNPKCESVSGCGTWVRPQIKNPAYKGKWKAPKIKNPNYKGKWVPAKVQNPAWFPLNDPVRALTDIGSIGLELWTMSDGIMFDNFIVTDHYTYADEYADLSYELKKSQENAQVKKGSFISGLTEAAETSPWLWAVYLIIVLIPIIMIVVFCFPSKKDNAKKTDEVQADDDVVEEDTEEAKAATTTVPGRKDKEDLEGDEEEEEGEEEVVEAKGSPKKNLRRRRQE